jgi:hypothetical protein
MPIHQSLADTPVTEGTSLLRDEGMRWQKEKEEGKYREKKRGKQKKEDRRANLFAPSLGL